MAALDLSDRTSLIEQAAQWLYENPNHDRPTLPELNDRFDLDLREGVGAIRRSRELWGEALREAREQDEGAG